MRRLLLFVMLLCLSTVSIHAQDGCDINLEDTILSLVQAQRAADSGDTLTAVALLQSVQDSIDSTTNGCDSIRFNETYTTPDETLSFRYPDGWQVQSLERGLYVIASSSAVFNQFGNDIPQELDAGDAAIALQIEPLDGDTFDELIDDLIDDIRADFNIISLREETEIRGRRVVSFNVQISDTVNGHISLVEALSDSEDTPSSLILLLGLANADSLPIMEVYTKTLRDSIQYPPGQSLRETGVSIDDINYTSVIELEEDFDINVRTAYLSATGTQLAYLGPEDTICVYTIVDDTQVCNEWPQSFRGQPTALQWSPDGRYIAFHQDFLRMFTEADIWVYNIQDDIFTNLTDDGVDNVGFGDDIEQETWFDFATAWGPDNLIYGVRQTVLPDTDSIQDGTHEIIQVNPDTGETTTLVDLTNTIEFGSIYEFPQYALNGTMAVSPDATQMAVTVANPRAEEPINGIWLIDFASGDIEQIASSTALQVGLPADIFEDGPNRGYIPVGIAWDGDSTGLFTTTIDSINFGGMVHHIDLNSGDIIPAIDLSDFTVEEFRNSADEGDSDLIVPLSAALAPDYQGVVILHLVQDNTTLTYIPFDGDFGDPQELFSTDEAPPFTQVVQIGLNGNLLMSRFLFENDN